MHTGTKSPIGRRYPSLKTRRQGATCFLRDGQDKAHCQLEKVCVTLRGDPTKLAGVRTSKWGSPSTSVDRWIFLAFWSFDKECDGGRFFFKLAPFERDFSVVQCTRIQEQQSQDTTHGFESAFQANISCRSAARDFVVLGADRYRRMRMLHIFSCMIHVVRRVSQNVVAVQTAGNIGKVPSTKNSGVLIRLRATTSRAP